LIDYFALMKNLLLCVLLLSFTTSLVFAQNEEKFVLRLDHFDSLEKVSLPFSAIKIIDARFDQSNVGCVLKNLSYKGIAPDKLIAVFPDSLNLYLPTVLNNFLKLEKNNKDTLVILVKQFRLADHILTTSDKSHEPETVIAISWSFYAATNNQLRKIFSIDDKMADKWSTVGEVDKKTISPIRSAIILRLLTGMFQNKNWTPSPLSFSWADAEKGLMQRFKLPALSEKTFKVGLYKTFDEFRNNNPSFTQIKFGIDNGSVLALDENRRIIDLKDYWGASDGQNRYIVFHRSLNQLIPSHKGFRFRSYRKEVTGSEYERVDLSHGFGFYARVPTKFRLQFEFFDLNMDNGLVYLEEMIGTNNYDRAMKLLNSPIY